jgi:hypothetical protein
MPFRFNTIALLCLLAAAVPLQTQAQTAPLTYPELSPARRAAIAQMLPQQPAGFGVPCTNREAWQQAALYFQGSIQRAQVFLASPLPPWDDNLYLRYSRDGNRDQGEAMINNHNGQLTQLVLAECSEWKGRFLPRIIEQLDAISAEPSWTLPAHDPHLLNFHGARYFVELNSAALGHNVAQALYLMGDKIPAATRKRAMDALEQRVFTPMRRAYAGQDPVNTGWLKIQNNWAAVCHNGVTGAALAVLPDRDDRALFAQAAEQWTPNYLGSYSDSGYDTEGIGYWVYGFSNYAQLREQLWVSTGGKIDLFDNSKARKAALFGFQFAMRPGIYANFGDATFASKPDPVVLAYVDRTFGLGQLHDDPAILRANRLGSLADAMQAAFPLDSERHDHEATAASLLGLRAWYPEYGILVDRPAPGGTLAITIKAGGNIYHSHNDIGSYSIGLNSTQVVGDPGGPMVYNADTFSDKRTTYRVINSFGHPVPEIDGALQLDATKVYPTVVSSNFTDNQDSVTLDITPAYNDPKLKKLIRTMQYSRANGGAVEITDQFTLDAAADIVECFPSHGVMKQIDAKTIQFDSQDAHLQIVIDAPGPITLTQDNINDMGNAFLRVGAKIHLASSGKVVMRFSQVPAA